MATAAVARSKRSDAASEFGASRGAGGRGKTTRLKAVGGRAATEAATSPAPQQVQSAASYRPQDGEAYMSPAQLAYFKTKLRGWRDRLMASVEPTRHVVNDADTDVGDEADSANATVQRSMDAHTQDHAARVLRAIDAALRRIASGDYGYCEETGEEIGLPRLEANPVARLSIEAQERAERASMSVAGGVVGGVL